MPHRTDDPVSPGASAPDTLEHKLVKAALKYAKRGWRVLPLRPGTKVPMLLDWQNLATTDPDLIREWWTKTPRANIGLATGAASDLWVLDVDLGHGKDAAKSMKKLRKKYGELAPTYTVKTPSGGLHHYFSYPVEAGATWRNKAGTVLGLGVDVRAEGGQVAAWPSVLSDGSAYTRTLRNEPVPVPTWLADLTRNLTPDAVHRPSIDPATLSMSDKTRLEKWTVGAVDGVVGDLVALGSLAKPDGRDYSGPPWNDTCFKAACRLIEIAEASWSPMSVPDAFDVFTTNAPRDAGFTDDDVVEIWKSASKRVSGNAIAVPEPIAALYFIPIADSDGDPRKGRVDPDTFFQKGEGLLAERLADRLLDDLAIGLDGKFWAYKAGVWARDDNALLARVTHALGDRYRPAHYSAVKDVVLASGRLPHLSADPNPDLINTRSGMVDWRTGRVLPHDPSYLSTVQLPVEYDPDAKCPRFDEWVGQVVTPSTLALLWETVGYLAMSGNPLQKVFLLFGEGGNGKGTFLRVILGILGRWNTSAVTLRSISEGKFEVATLLGKVANIAGDIDARYLKDTSRLKALTGEDMVEAQHKYKDPFFFLNWAVPVFSANEMWRSSDTTEGYLRRWVTIPFPNSVAGLAPLDERTLHAEAPGILAHGLRSLRELMARGDFDVYGDAADLKHTFTEESDLIRLWLREDDHVLEAEAGRQGYGAPKLLRSTLYRCFRDWARESGHGEMSSTTFYRRLRRMDYRETTSGGRSFYGIRLDVVDRVSHDANSYGLGGPGMAS